MNWEAFNDKLSAFGDGVGRRLKELFGSHTERQVKGLTPLVAEISALEGWAQGLTPEQFKAQTAEWKAAVADGRTSLEEVLPRPSRWCARPACARWACGTSTCRWSAASCCTAATIAEMMTGEGKTLVATLPLYLNCLAGKPVYLVTVNDYLARRDCAWMKPIYDYLGVASGAIQSNMGGFERKPLYASDIVYGTNNEFGFDYLRDNMKLSASRIRCSAT
jgi:preprotein translocase subunit SecA